ncbi:hypothetical protein ANANG_G00278600 [Anguilla anguilla]|uniref:Uncharacterized protein n=1 Tax=Anguilla anguilla TaxID=7936 RepID=A0A9D3RKC5_ANGAN|nr:hypothetical protein ANANG_G00278600 [Anguilla anguilla]
MCCLVESAEQRAAGSDARDPPRRPPALRLCTESSGTRQRSPLSLTLSDGLGHKVPCLTALLLEAAERLALRLHARVPARPATGRGDLKAPPSARSAFISGRPLLWRALQSGSTKEAECWGGTELTRCGRALRPVPPNLKQRRKGRSHSGHLRKGHAPEHAPLPSPPQRSAPWEDRVINNGTIRFLIGQPPAPRPLPMVPLH